MGLNDLYYREYVKYLRELEKDKEALKLRRVIKATDVEKDKLETVKLVIKIDEQWVKNIEEGLVYVEKAVREERQFIRTEGDVVPVERAKHTSKATVEHLAKHSNFITHLPEKEGDNLVPDKLYIVEKESDYAVYENRFLYMMLTYLRDFIGIRLNRIRDKMTTYRGRYSMDKDVNLSHRRLKIEVKFSDEIKDDPILLKKYKSIKIIDRIEMQYHLVLALLSTPLMEQVSKAPMLKPPITKTNTLKMNTNFKTSLALYDYISAYNTDGYEFSEEVVELAPLADEAAEEYAEMIALNAYLTYKASNGLSKELKASYEEFEKNLRDQEKQQKEEQLKRLKRHINESGESLEEYIVALENMNRQLEKEGVELVQARKQIDELRVDLKATEEKNMELLGDIDELNQTIINKDLEYKKLEEKGASDLLVSEQVHRQEIVKLNEEHQTELERLAKLHEENVANINKKHEEDIAEVNRLNELAREKEVKEKTASLVADYDKQLNKSNNVIDSLNNDLDKQTSRLRETEAKLQTALDDKKRMINDYEDKIYNLIKAHRETDADYDKKIEERDKEIKKYQKRIEHLIQERKFVEAQLHIIRVEQGKITDEWDYTSRERFEELEAQYNAFRLLFKKEWTKTKKRIRDEVFHSDDDDNSKKETAKEEKASDDANSEAVNEKPASVEDSKPIQEDAPKEQENEPTSEGESNE